MKINKGKIKNINKKLLTLGMAVVMTTSFAGCGASGFEYKEGKNSEIVASGTIDCDYLSDCCLVETYNKVKEKSDLYICDKIKNYCFSGAYYFIKSIQYGDLLNGEIIYNSKEKIKLIEIIKEEKMTDYLYAYEEIKSKYTVDDVTRILEEIKQDYEFSKEKQLAKK